MVREFVGNNMIVIDFVSCLYADNGPEYDFVVTTITFKPESTLLSCV